MENIGNINQINNGEVHEPRTSSLIIQIEKIL